MTDMQEAVADILETDAYCIRLTCSSLNFVNDCYGIDNVEQLEEAYSGCFPSVEAFSENFTKNTCYSDALDAMPTLLQTAVDYEMVWHQSLQYDYTEIYFDYEYYFFNRTVTNSNYIEITIRRYY